MKTIPITDAAAGDRLAADLRSDTGALILGKGSELTAPLLTRLARMGVGSVSVESSAQASEEETGKALAALDHRFCGHENDPYMAEMKRVARLSLERSAAPTPGG